MQVTTRGGTRHGRARLAAALALLALGCGIAREDAGYSAEIRRTAYGIPHIEARDWGSLGFGAGYTQAEDNLCLLAELVVSAAAQRSRWFGASAENLASDYYHQLLIDRGEADEPGLSPEMDAFIRGAAAGYDRLLRDLGPQGIRDPRCRGAGWVREIDARDLRRLHRANQFAEMLSPLIVAAAPPGQPSALVSLPRNPADLDAGDLGSNAIALGSEATRSGNAMFLGNPHQPWTGSFRFYMKHLTIPGELDILGASPMGRPFAGVGHNCCLAWNGTVSRATRHSFYRIALVPGRPTAYLFDGVEHEMTSREVAIEVPGPDGVLQTRRHRFWFTHFGALVAAPGMPWSAQSAWALRHVDSGWRSVNEIAELARASSVREAKAILDRQQGWPVNILMADHTGEVLYADPGAAAHLEDAQLEACSVPGGLDGTRGECQWGSDPDAVAPGIFGPARLPFLFRRDWVANFNDSYWLSNTAQPLEGYPRALGEERTPRSLRTRIGLRMLGERLSGSDGRPARFTLDELAGLLYANRDLGGELLRDDLVALCRARPAAAGVDLREACAVLARWDLHMDLESRGAHLFREFLREGGARFAVPFDPGDPVATPRTLDRSDPQVLEALARAVQKLAQAGVALDAPLGEVQGVVRAGRRIPLHGGPGDLGGFNALRAPLGRGGYGEIEAGTSFVMAVEFTPQGPVSRAFISYSQSADETSPHFADQTELYSRKGWVDLAWRRSAQLADPELRTYRVSGPR